ncbi:hypothetical protein D3C84_919670 [compost metagenome]
MPEAMISRVSTRQAPRRDQPHSSQVKRTRCSSMEMEEESAATSSNRKNTTPSPWPNGRWLNTAGMVMKVRPGPAVGSMPVEASAGKIISPASTEIRLARVTTQTPERSTPSLLGR